MITVIWAKLNIELWLASRNSHSQIAEALFSPNAILSESKNFYVLEISGKNNRETRDLDQY